MKKSIVDLTSATKCSLNNFMQSVIKKTLECLISTLINNYSRLKNRHFIPSE